MSRLSGMEEQKQEETVNRLGEEEENEESESESVRALPSDAVKELSSEGVSFCNSSSFSFSSFSLLTAISHHIAGMRPLHLSPLRPPRPRLCFSSLPLFSLRHHRSTLHTLLRYSAVHVLFRRHQNPRSKRQPPTSHC